MKVAGFNLMVDADDDGIGGEVATEGSDTFDSDTLVGLNGRWYFRPDIALVTGYEYGNITTWNLGVRFTF